MILVLLASSQGQELITPYSASGKCHEARGTLGHWAITAFILEEAVADDTTDMLTNANTPKAIPGGHGRDTNDTSYGVRTEGMQGFFTHTSL